MKRLSSCLILFLLLGTEVGLCQTTFNHRFTIGNELWNQAHSVIENEGGYAVICTSADTINPSAPKVVFTQFDFEGNVLFHNIHGGGGTVTDFLVCSEDVMHKNSSDEYVIATYALDEDTVQFGQIVWLNFLGDTLRSSSIYSPNVNLDGNLTDTMFPTSLRIDDDDNIYVVFRGKHPVTSSDFFLYKIDNQGNVLWEFIYATNNHSDRIYAIELFEDQVICAVTQIEEDPGSIERLVLLSQEDGSEINIIEHPATAFSVSTEEILNINDSLLLFASGMDLPFDDGYDQIPSLKALDQNLEHVWTFTYGTEIDYLSHRYKDVVQAEDGGFVMSDRIVIVEPENEDDPINGSSNRYGRLVKCDDQGEFVWARLYAFVNDLYEQHEIRDLKATSDGGFIFCGIAEGDHFYDEDPDEQYQQAWLVKTDEFGCLVPGCQLINIDETTQETIYFKAGPNPVASSSSLNVFLFNDLAGTFTIRDNIGRLRQSFDTKHGNSTFMISLQNYASGIYHLSLTDERGRVLQSEKIQVAD